MLEFLSLWRHSKIQAALTYSPPQHDFLFCIFFLVV